MKNKLARKSALFATLALALSASAAHAQTVIHVDDDASPGGDGLTWATAYVYLQDALAAAADPDRTVTEIRVAGGTYTPDRDEDGNVTNGDRAETFQLISGVGVFGGYAGLASPADPQNRSIHLFETILSGDLDGDDGPDFQDNDENAFHVVTGSGTGGSAVLDGFTITAGNANGPDSPFRQDRGGGMFIDRGSPTLGNCTFRGNTATLGGGGLNNEQSGPVLNNCVFDGNSVGFSGAGVRGWASSPIFNNCRFIANTAQAGGAMWYGASTATLINCTFAENSAPEGNALHLSSCCPEQPSNLQIINCIFWDGGNEITNTDGSTITITFSDVAGGWTNDDCPAEHPVCNIDADPLFVSGPAGRHYLSQIAACAAADSPCVDAGSNMAGDKGLDTLTTRSDEVADTGLVDMGYHYPVTGVPAIMGDYDHDGNVDLADFAWFQKCFSGEGPTDVSPCCRVFDAEADDDVDLVDFVLFVFQ